jgi:hypothetical protein
VSEPPLFFVYGAAPLRFQLDVRQFCWENFLEKVRLTVPISAVKVPLRPYFFCPSTAFWRENFFISRGEISSKAQNVR